MEQKLTSDLLMSLTGAALSLLAYLIPPFRRFQESLGEWTPAFMAGVLLAGSLLYSAAWCAWDWSCFVANIGSTLLVWLSALGTNYAAYKGIVKPVKERSA